MNNKACIGGCKNNSDTSFDSQTSRREDSYLSVDDIWTLTWNPCCIVLKQRKCLLYTVDFFTLNYQFFELSRQVPLNTLVMSGYLPGTKVIKLEFIFKLKIKRNDWLLSSQSLRFILSLRLYSSCITSGPVLHSEDDLSFSRRLTVSILNTENMSFQARLW